MSALPLIVEALLKPGAYPCKPQDVELAQTQMSFIFLTGNYVYKVKKPVNLGYLDYTTLEKRKFYCYQELELNRRLCPNVYLEVVPVVRGGDSIFVEAHGEAIEYAVKMRQLPRERMMDRLLSTGQVSLEMVTRVAQRLAEFHQKAETDPQISAYGDVDIISGNAEENFAQTEKYIGVSISARGYRHIKDYTDRFIQQNTPLFRKRVEEGRIRDCHGDLHAAHICFINGICIYDCIEFNDRFRYSDVASEVAFLAMDMDRYGCGDLSHCFVDAYVELSHDGELLHLLDFYKCYRAYVRGKVESFKLDDTYISEGEKQEALGAAGRYFALAYSYARGRPLLIITTGLVGTGKTDLSHALAHRLGMPVISSDIIRKELADIPLDEHRFEEFEGGIYSEDFSRGTYSRMLIETRSLLSRGSSVIIDASFKKADERYRAGRLAEEMDADFLIIECALDEETIKQRLKQRIKEGSVSDGRWEIYQSQKADFEAVRGVPQQNHVIVDTSRPVNEVASFILEKIG